MSKPEKTAITPRRDQDYPEWYQQVIKASDLAEHSPVRGCMVIKPWGYGLWENMQQALDKMFKDTGHVNAYFPLLIPLSFMEKEAEHVEGFAKECAVVTHHRLESHEGGLRPAGELEEPFIIRPTSETIIGATYAKWVNSYRDLPILINQWANVMRWEMRTRLFLRTAEFLWQEGHTVHATAEEAQEETLQMLDIYQRFAQEFMAMPVIKGEKTAEERFPGAVNTYSIEAMMQDNKALQAGTSHFLGQNFAKASNIKFLDQNNQEQLAWTTSWGVSTRLVGALVMTHSDDDGLVLPPKLAPTQVVIQPIYKQDSRAQVLEFCQKLKSSCSKNPEGEPIRIEIDDRDLRGGKKTWNNIKRGIPIRLDIGQRDIEKNQTVLSRRDRPPSEKMPVSVDELPVKLPLLCKEIQESLYHQAATRQKENTHILKDKSEFEEFFAGKGGFARCHSSHDQDIINRCQKLKVTARCIPAADNQEKGQCIFTGAPGAKQVIYAKAY